MKNEKLLSLILIISTTFFLGYFIYRTIHSNRTNKELIRGQEENMRRQEEAQKRDEEILRRQEEHLREHHNSRPRNQLEP